MEEWREGGGREGEGGRVRGREGAKRECMNSREGKKVKRKK